MYISSLCLSLHLSLLLPLSLPLSLPPCPPLSLSLSPFLHLLTVHLLYPPPLSTSSVHLLYPPLSTSSVHLLYPPLSTSSRRGKLIHANAQVKTILRPHFPTGPSGTGLSELSIHTLPSISASQQAAVNASFSDACEGKFTAPLKVRMFTDRIQSELMFILSGHLDSRGIVDGVVTIVHGRPVESDHSSELSHLAMDLKQVIDTANAPIIGTDANGLINEWNRKVATFATSQTSYLPCLRPHICYASDPIIAISPKSYLPYRSPHICRISHPTYSSSPTP